ncbi:hypothetical protein LTS15_007102 [Exophiala xenobiotica]|nr:hypothetical protein LTS15_007102 [Exophiala xenobiotica]
MPPIIPATDPIYAQSLLSHPPQSEPAPVSSTITTLKLQPHIEGGYFVETDRDKLLVPNPFRNLPLLTNATSKDTSTTRHASTTIYYLLAPESPVGYFHRNRGRTVHTLHRGRGRYVLLHVDQRDEQGRVPVETFVVGQNIERGERVQWIVEGGKFKASFLLPDRDSDRDGDDIGVSGEEMGEMTDDFSDDGSGIGAGSEKGLLISETVVPGFEFSDHDFLTAEGMVDAFANDDKARDELRWLLKRGEQGRLDELVRKR